VLGENAGGEDMMLPMYSIAVAEYGGLEDPIDLRPVQTYQAEEGSMLGEAFTGRFMERQGVQLSGTGDGLEWEFGVGLASMYGLEFRFLNRSGKDIQVNMKLAGVNGIEYLSEELIFSGERPRWQSVRTDTRSMINAGKYRIILTLEEDEEICFNWLRVQ
jgi:hypothetical protein